MIICNFNMFDKEQKIIEVNSETKKTSIVAVSNFDDLGINIARACQNIEDYKIHLYGSTDFLETAVIPQIKKYLGLTYGLDNLEIEVN